MRIANYLLPIFMLTNIISAQDNLEQKNTEIRTSIVKKLKIKSSYVITDSNLKYSEIFYVLTANFDETFFKNKFHNETKFFAEDYEYEDKRKFLKQFSTFPQFFFYEEIFETPNILNNNKNGTIIYKTKIDKAYIENAYGNLEVQLSDFIESPESNIQFSLPKNYNENESEPKSFKVITLFEIKGVYTKRVLAEVCDARHYGQCIAYKKEFVNKRYLKIIPRYSEIIEQKAAN